MKLHSLSAAALVAFAAPAFAENCADTSWTALASTSCEGSFLGNINGSAEELTGLTGFFGGTWTYEGKSDDTANGPFTDNPTSTSGTLTFDSPISGVFVIGLKAGDNYSYYYFDAGVSSISSLSFDTTAGVATNAQGMAQALSHAALYVGEGVVPGIPEPETYALMLAGLGAITWVARRRRRA
jgi:PEP-CTERM motif